ncbi:hypothetical protein Trydic_g10045 [Trypoxylus dichotomus]
MTIRRWQNDTGLTYTPTLCNGFEKESNDKRFDDNLCNVHSGIVEIFIRDLQNYLVEDLPFMELRHHLVQPTPKDKEKMEKPGPGIG